MPGPLHGVRVVELGGVGPGPHAAMMLADLGADVVRLLRPPQQRNALDSAWQPRGCDSVSLDLKNDQGRREALDLLAVTDVLIEGFRPGVAERLGIGPDICLRRNPALIYGRITGWGQTGPYSAKAGHDINYLAIAGLLHTIGTAAGPPVPPLSLVGDFGGGSMLLLAGVLAALAERYRSGRGQVVDASMLDGALVLGDLFIAQHSAGEWTDERENNLLDGGAPFYRTYECADSRHVAVGALERQFFTRLAAVLKLDLPEDFDHLDRTTWPYLRDRLAATFACRERDYWTALFADHDACVTPVLSLAEMPEDPHITSRELITRRSGVRRAAPAPRFSRTPAGSTHSPTPGRGVGEIVEQWQE
ncbi:alpha-methylacyl-CoA racemase (Mcr)-like protein [Nocardia nova SH22a]|uniref:Alpha-methylacyl-CoA racemase (Mcr)-like protein n=1 Tax=Nocardia nova SH22a TaxID=1415166 RepID=W5TGU4_9NOCA|nr:CaiB/BaiF CoA-transferase family protein [Nocardia nova]AHH18590.1 alpha-methylacyl-CoA racemase (Mcr)-like protein [Nocardia nova SH22a]